MRLELAGNYADDAADFFHRYRVTFYSEEVDYQGIKSRRAKAYVDLRMALEALLKATLCLRMATDLDNLRRRARYSISVFYFRELVDWARATGFRVVAAGKGTKYLPIYHDVTPSGVWSHYGLTADEAQSAGMNPQMFNSFLDGTKSAIEMAAIANATGLDVPAHGLLFPPCGVDDLPHVMRPSDKGGVLEKAGVVEVVSSLERDGRPVFRDLRWGVYVVLEAPNDYAADCFRQYGLKTDASGRYAAMYKPYHLIGLELNISVLSAALRKEPTGQPHGFRGDVAAVAKRDLRAGEMLDGEGGYTVWGKLMPAAASLKAGALPIGLAHRVKLKRDIAHGAVVRWSDVEIDAGDETVKTRRAMEAQFNEDVWGANPHVP